LSVPVCSFESPISPSHHLKTHGLVCVYYIGRRPNIVIPDPEMLRKIMVKDFSSFTNRMVCPGSRWQVMEKVVGSVVLVSFQMVPLINKATETLLTNRKTHADSGLSFDIHRSFGCFTMDVIASVGFGTQVDSQKNPKDPFVYHAQKFFSFTFFPSPFVFPFLIAPLAQLLPNKSRYEMNSFFIGCIKVMIKQRDKLPASQRRCEFLQLMLEVRSEREYVLLDQFDLVSHADDSTQAADRGKAADEAPRRMQRRVMTEDEIVGQVFIFLLAGYETSSSTLAFVCYLLAIHPECQQRVQEEVDGFFSMTVPDYHNVQELNRGAALDIPVGFLHHHPESWPDPEDLIPERFSAEARAIRHPFVYLPFGAGPRNCVGARLAMLEIRLAVVHIFRKFTLLACK
uniref:Thromboxane-A synthase n=1 Tax=Paramormyrops kingsleyae TaxID=1676925 RepID=A0A3B3T8K5_9TELE